MGEYSVGKHLNVSVAYFISKSLLMLINRSAPFYTKEKLMLMI